MKQRSVININRESMVVSTVWAFLSLFAFVIHLQRVRHGEQEPVVSALIVSRNILVVAILYYYSIYKILQDFELSKKAHQSDQLSELGDVAIGDFKLAMKTELSLRYFKAHIQSLADPISLFDEMFTLTTSAHSDLRSKKSKRRGHH
mmetsp:Transcript_6769/g.10887  ORF Transcript_6769/g.10887 Transcript_6769/m.10887 type:complete len:147 (-) Transcript_6769:19-459(-)